MARRTERGLGRPVFGYATMLATMVVAATHLDSTLSPASRRLTAAGAGMFMLSDTLLGIRKFMLTDPAPALESAVMATYTTAQFLLSEGAAGPEASRAAGLVCPPLRSLLDHQRRHRTDEWGGTERVGPTPPLPPY